MIFSKQEDNVMVICIISVVGFIGSILFCCFICYLCLAIQQKIDTFYNGDV
jgi:hypothetical protein